jgi:glutathione-regulated potassium-efflux system ancillary protein KefC
MDPAWILVAFVLGLAARQLGQPPLLGFLMAGFILKAFGVESDATLEQLADMGVYLLLFSIGLKLRIRSLLQPEVWAVASLHMLVTVGVFAGVFVALAAASLSLFAGLDLAGCALMAFAASFSSTVFAVKVLEEKGEADSRHGRGSIGILVVQDILAVVFLTLSAEETPSLWAFALVGLIAVRPALYMILSRAGHGELLVLLGWLLPLAGAALFSGVGLKPDLGALVLGALLAGHEKSGELSKALLSFKELFLVAFFLTVGLSGVLTLEVVLLALLLVVALPFKVALFYLLLTRFRLRARTATLSSLTLANYSEFGLIVAALGAKSGWIDPQWLTISAVALAVSFLLAAPLNTRSHDIYIRWRSLLQRLETSRRLPGDDVVSPGDATVVILGMGRVGTAAYDELVGESGLSVMGLELDEERVRGHVQAGRRVVVGDATDSDFWERLDYMGGVRVALLAMTDHAAAMDVTRRLKAIGFGGLIAATASHADEVEELKSAGAEVARDFFSEAGAGFAEHVTERAQAQGLL